MLKILRRIFSAAAVLFQQQQPQQTVEPRPTLAGLLDDLIAATPRKPGAVRWDDYQGPWPRLICREGVTHVAIDPGPPAVDQPRLASWCGSAATPATEKRGLRDAEMDAFLRDGAVEPPR
jgi:hypothetical protein